jgi:NHL repeat
MSYIAFPFGKQHSSSMTTSSYEEFRSHDFGALDGEPVSMCVTSHDTLVVGVAQVGLAVGQAAQMQSTIVEFTMDGKFIQNFGRSGIGPGGLGWPFSIAETNSGAYAIVNLAPPVHGAAAESAVPYPLQILGADGTFVRQIPFDGSCVSVAIRTNPKGNTSVNTTSTDAHDDDNNDMMFILDSDGGVFRVDSNGARECRVGMQNGTCIIDDPTCLAIQHVNNLVLVFDNESCQIVACDYEGKVVSTYGRKGTRLGEFQDVQDITTSADGHIVVCDAFNNWIQVLSPSGEPLCILSPPTHSFLPFKYPHAVAVSRTGDIFVCDGYTNKRIVKICSKQSSTCTDANDFE